MRPTACKNELIIGKDYSKVLLSHIRNARSSIYILMFVWRWRIRDPASDMSLINQAILQASRRGVKVKIFCNFSGMAEQLNRIGLEAKAWQKTKIMHAKGILIDEDTLLLGSHNLTDPAMGFNVEVSAVLYDTDLCVQFKKYFLTLWQ